MKRRAGPSSNGTKAPCCVLVATRHREGLLLGRMAGLWFDLGDEGDLRMLTSDVAGSAGIEAEKLDVTPWLVWFLECLSRAIAGAGSLVDGVLRKADVWRSLATGKPVNDRQRQVINRLLDGFEGGLSTAKYARMAKCSADTALRDIQDLVQRGVLAKNAAGGRSTSYRLAPHTPDSGTTSPS